MARAAVAILVGVLAVACGSSSAPTAPSAVHGTSVAITGPAKLLVGGTAQLTAAINLADGTQKPCPNAAWTSSAPATASISASGLVQALAPGDVTITANCDATSGSLALSSLAKIAVQGTVHESAPTTSTALAGVTVSVVDAVGQQLSTTTDAAGHFSVTAAAGPATLQASQAGYQPVSLTPTLSEDAGPIDVALSPTDQDVSISGTSSVCSTHNELNSLCVKRGVTNQSSHFLIDVHNPGTITIQTWWWLDYHGDFLAIDVTCGGSSIYHVEQEESSQGQENRVQVPGGCRYDVAFRFNSGSEPTVGFGYAIKHPS